MTLEGTWEEILAHAPELAGRRVRLMVLETEGTAAAEPPLSPAEQFAAALDELEKDDEMPLTPVSPGNDSVTLIREGRAGAMWGYDPYE